MMEITAQSIATLPVSPPPRPAALTGIAILLLLMGVGMAAFRELVVLPVAEQGFPYIVAVHGAPDYYPLIIHTYNLIAGVLCLLFAIGLLCRQRWAFRFLPVALVMIFCLSPLLDVAYSYYWLHGQHRLDKMQMLALECTCNVLPMFLWGGLAWYLRSRPLVAAIFADSPKTLSPYDRHDIPLAVTLATVLSTFLTLAAIVELVLAFIPYAPPVWDGSQKAFCLILVPCLIALSILQVGLLRLRRWAWQCALPILAYTTFFEVFGWIALNRASDTAFIYSVTLGLSIVDVIALCLLNRSVVEAAFVD